MMFRLGMLLCSFLALYSLVSTQDSTTPAFLDVHGFLSSVCVLACFIRDVEVTTQLLRSIAKRRNECPTILRRLLGPAQRLYYTIPVS